MGIAGKMLNHLRRDCWGCDNKIMHLHKRCTCQTNSTSRTKEKRQWKKDMKHD